MHQIAIVIKPVKTDEPGQVKILYDETMFTAVSMDPTREFLQNELVKVADIKDNIAFCQHGMM